MAEEGQSFHRDTETYLKALAKRSNEHACPSFANPLALRARLCAKLTLHDGEDTLDPDAHSHSWDIFAAVHADEAVVPAKASSISKHMWNGKRAE
jgi:hypothetical protein